MARQPAVLEEKYDFEFDVGQWTYGTISVYKHRASDKLRTCKTVPKHLVPVRGGEVLQLKSLRALSHRHICSVMDALEDSQYFYIMAEYVQGGELSDWAERLDENHVIQEQTCAAYIRQALIAMVHAHSFQVFHGALLPSSLSLSSKMPDAHVKVSDFGLAGILDPDNMILQRNRSPYTAPEILSGEAACLDVTADIYSLGAIAHALLVGRAPGAEPQPTGGIFSRAIGGQRRGGDLEAAWVERSALSRDFVRKLLAPWDERLTAARALQHPWLKGVQTPTASMTEKDMAKDMKLRILCHSLAILLVPVTSPFRDFEQLQQGFAQSDIDFDGMIPLNYARQILCQRCSIGEAVDHALAVADVYGSNVFDLCSCACADLIARQFFAAGPTGQQLSGPFGASDLAPKMLKKFLEVFGGRQQTATLQGIKARLRTATYHEVETHAGVDYEELLSDLPEGAIDGQTLASLLCANGGRGTPLVADDSPAKPANDTFFGGFMGLFQQCMAGNHTRDDPPF